MLCKYVFDLKNEMTLFVIDGNMWFPILMKRTFLGFEFSQSLRAFRRPMHAWMLWIAVGTGRMKDALWMNVKQGIVSCDYKYYASRLTAVLMFGSYRL